MTSQQSEDTPPDEIAECVAELKADGFDVRFVYAGELQPMPVPDTDEE